MNYYSRSLERGCVQKLNTYTTFFLIKILLINYFVLKSLKIAFENSAFRWRCEIFRVMSTPPIHKKLLNFFSTKRNIEYFFIIMTPKEGHSLRSDHFHVDKAVRCAGPPMAGCVAFVARCEEREREDNRTIALARACG